MDPVRKRRRLRSISNQAFPANVSIECSKAVRKRHPIGTIFKINLAVSQKEGGGIYAHAKSKTELLTICEWESIYG